MKKNRKRKDLSKVLPVAERGRGRSVQIVKDNYRTLGAVLCFFHPPLELQRYCGAFPRLAHFCIADIISQ